MKWFVFLLLSSVVIACKNKKDESPFATVLNEPAYAGLTDSIRKEPANPDLYFQRAVRLNRNDFPEPALADFKKAWSLKKDERYAVGTATLLLDRNADSAVLFIEDALKDLPKSFLLKLTLARTYLGLNKPDAALAICNELLGENPDQVDVLKMKADIYGRTGKIAEAINTLRSAYALTPQDIELNYMLALKMAEAKDARVVALCDSLIRADSLQVHAEPYYYKGIYYSSVNDKQKALSMFDMSVKTDYNFLDGYIEKGSILYEMKKYLEAMNVFRLALTISPKFADAYYWIAKTQEATGDKEAARLNYERTLGLDKDFTEAKEALQRLK